MYQRIKHKVAAFLLGEIAFTTAQKFLISLCIVAVAFGFRTALHPVLGPDRYVFPAFYLAIVLIAFVAGTVPALFASIIAAPIAYWAFSEPAFSLTYKAGAVAALNFHILTTGLNLLFLALLRRTLAESRRERQRAEEVAASHADMFREFNHRAVNHLQLVSALLDSRSRSEEDGEFAVMVARASANTLMISNLHRRMNGDEDVATRLQLFLHQVASGLIETSSSPETTFQVVGDDIELPSGQAISVSIVVAETLRLLLADHPASIAISIIGSATAPIVEIRAKAGQATPMSNKPARAFSQAFIDATVAQLHARYSLDQTSDATVARLELPDRSLSTAPAGIDQWAGTGSLTRH